MCTARRNAAVHNKLQEEAQQLVENKKKSKVPSLSLCSPCRLTLCADSPPPNSHGTRPAAGQAPVTIDD